MYKIMGEQVKITVKRLKLKDSPGGSILVHTDTLDKSDTKPRLSRKERKAARKVKCDDKKQARIVERNARKEAQAVDRLEY